MVEIGKRSRSYKNDRDGKNQKRRMARNEKSDDEVIVYRILCPNNVIGSVIGKSGKVINSIRQETKARVKVVEPFPGAKDRVITIYCYVKDKEDVGVDEEFHATEPFCAAQDALLKVHGAIVNAVLNARESEKKEKGKEECQLLVPSSQSANIIGKSGAMIKKLRNKTNANIKVMSKDVSDPTHSCALDFDNFVLITGDSDAVVKALFAISAIMFKFTPKEEIPLDSSAPEAHPSIIIPSDVPVYPAPGLYSSVDPMVPSRSLPSVLGPTHVSEVSGYGDARSTFPVYSSALPFVSGFGGASRPKELTIRVLCPFKNIGRVIGRGGASIKSVRQASGARVEVDDAKADRNECIITVISDESTEDLKSMAVEAVLLLQEKINGEDDAIVSFRLLVPSKVIGCIIGKSGSIINEVRKRTRADIRISKDNKPKCADAGDELVEVVGEVGSVRDALVQIALRLRDEVLTDKEADRNPFPNAEPLHSAGAGRLMPSFMPGVSSVAPLNYEQRAESGNGLGLLSLYGHGSLRMGEDGYGSLSSYSPKMYGGMPPPSTSEMVVPAYAVGKVMGKGGTNMENIRKISGADIKILELNSSQGDRVAVISGTSEQKRAAEDLIRAFIMAT